MTSRLAMPLLKPPFIKGLLPMEATVRRSVLGPEDEWGHPTEGSETEHDIPCFMQQGAEREAVSERVSAVVEDYRLVCPLESDVVETDNIVNVRGYDSQITLWPGPLAIDAVMPRPEGSFKTLVLRQVSS